MAEFQRSRLPDSLRDGFVDQRIEVFRANHAQHLRHLLGRGSDVSAGDLSRFGLLLVEGHESLKQDYDWPSAEADLLVGSAVAHGAYGARLTTSGREEAIVMLAPPESEARILAQVSQDFQDRFGRVLQVWSTRAAAGVRRETVKGER